MLQTMKTCPWWLYPIVFLMAVGQLSSQTDTLPNNLVHVPGYQTSAWSSLPFQKIGTGKQVLLLLAGWGFDDSVFRDFARSHLNEYTMYLLTLPGYGDSRAYPMPPAGTSYSEGTWMKGVQQGILHLLEAEHIQRPVLVAHFAVSSHIALQLAFEYPGKFQKLILAGAPALFRNPPPYDTLNYPGRVRSVDHFLAPKWFKTVSMETWRNGNFPPAVYACDSLTGRQLYEQANSALLPVQIRYLCEAWAADYSIYERINLPVLTIVPSFTPALFQNPANIYLPWYTDEWDKLAAKNPNFRVVRVLESGCNVMQDKPGQFSRLLTTFLEE